MASQSTRKVTDLKKLMKNGYEVEMINDSVDKFYVFFNGPPDSLYSRGVWRVKVNLTEDYPSKPPLVLFDTKIYHPNIHLTNGFVCIDMLQKENWISSYDLVMVFDYYLPQLLVEPNVADPMNFEAAGLFIFNKETYEATVKDYVKQCTKPKDVGVVPEMEPSVDPANEAPTVVPGNEAGAAGPEDEETAAGIGSVNESTAAGRIDL